MPGKHLAPPVGRHRRQIAGREVERDLAAFAGFERNTLEPAQGDARRAGQLRNLEIKLHHLVAIARAGVAHLRGHADALGGIALHRRDLGRGIGKAGIAEPVAEAIDRGAREIAIGAALYRIIVKGRQILDIAIEGQRQTPRRIGRARQDIGHRQPARLARIPGLENGIGIVLGPAQIDRAAVHRHHGQRLARSLRLGQQFALIGGQFERGLVAPVKALDLDRHFLAFQLGGQAHHGQHDIGILHRARHFAIGVMRNPFPEHARRGRAAALHVEMHLVTLALFQIDIDKFGPLAPERVAVGFDHRLAVDLDSALHRRHGKAIGAGVRRNEIAVPYHLVGVGHLLQFRSLG